MRIGTHMCTDRRICNFSVLNKLRLRRFLIWRLDWAWDFGFAIRVVSMITWIQVCGDHGLNGRYIRSVTLSRAPSRETFNGTSRTRWVCYNLGVCGDNKDTSYGENTNSPKTTGMFLPGHILWTAGDNRSFSRWTFYVPRDVLTNSLSTYLGLLYLCSCTPPLLTQWEPTHEPILTRAPTIRCFRQVHL